MTENENNENREENAAVPKRGGGDPWQPPITDEEFDVIRAFAYEHAGISIADYKRNMVYRRVSKRLRALGMSDMAPYIALLRSHEGAREIQPLLNALTTNKTSLFREEHHFEHLARDFLPGLAARAALGGGRRLRIWSAGCSSGEEAYSLAITLHEALPDLPKWDARILATDIDTEMVEVGRRGVYPREALRDAPVDIRARYFAPKAGGRDVEAVKPLRDMITFKPLNLMDEWPMRGPFDAIFCRNVVIYFDKPTQRQLFARVADLLAPGGALYIGHSESLYKVSERFRPLGRSIYRLEAAASAMPKPVAA